MAVRRYGTSADVAAALAFLLGVQNEFVALQVLNMAGGFASSRMTNDPAEGA